jgi:hypothetical protein
MVRWTHPASSGSGVQEYERGTCHLPAGLKRPLTWKCVRFQRVNLKNSVIRIFILKIFNFHYPLLCIFENLTFHYIK